MLGYRYLRGSSKFIIGSCDTKLLELLDCKDCSTLGHCILMSSDILELCFNRFPKLETLCMCGIWPSLN
ncbi:hypothetical protein ABKV19_026517 [Rosa sericea]